MKQSTLKTTLATLFCSLLFSQAVSAQTIEKNYSLELTSPDQPMLLELEMLSGAATIIGYDGKTVEINAKLSPLTSDQIKEKERRNQGWRGGWNNGEKKKMRSTEGLTAVQNVSFNLEIEETNNRVEIESEYSSFFVELEIRVPKTASMELEMHSGEKIEVNNILGSVEAETHRGDIIANNISGPIVVESHNNDIIVDFASLNNKSPTSFTTHNGDIDLTFQSDIAATIQVQNYKGEILSGLDIAFDSVDKVSNDSRSNKKQINIGAQLEGKLNGGGQQVVLNTYGGNVYLRKK